MTSTQKCGSDRIFAQLNYGLISFGPGMRCRKLYKCKYESWHNQIKSNRWTQFTLPLVCSHSHSHTPRDTCSMHYFLDKAIHSVWMICISDVHRCHHFHINNFFFFRKLAEWIVLLRRRSFAECALCASFELRTMHISRSICWVKTWIGTARSHSTVDTRQINLIKFIEKKNFSTHRIPILSNISTYTLLFNQSIGYDGWRSDKELILLPGWFLGLWFALHRHVDCGAVETWECRRDYCKLECLNLIRYVWCEQSISKFYWHFQCTEKYDVYRLLSARGERTNANDQSQPTFQRLPTIQKMEWHKRGIKIERPINMSHFSSILNAIIHENYFVFDFRVPERFISTMYKYFEVKELHLL